MKDLLTIPAHNCGKLDGRLLRTYDNFKRRKAGDGWLRLLEFSNDGTSIGAIDYSPTRNQCDVSEQNRFSIQYV